MERGKEKKIERVQNYRNILELVWFIFLFNKVQWTAINKYKIRKNKLLKDFKQQIRTTHTLIHIHTLAQVRKKTSELVSQSVNQSMSQ